MITLLHNPITSKQFTAADADRVLGWAHQFVDDWQQDMAAPDPEAFGATDASNLLEALEPLLLMAPALSAHYAKLQHAFRNNLAGKFNLLETSLEEIIEKVKRELESGEAGVEAHEVLFPGSGVKRRSRQPRDMEVTVMDTASALFCHALRPDITYRRPLDRCTVYFHATPEEVIALGDEMIEHGDPEVVGVVAMAQDLRQAGLAELQKRLSE